MKEKVYELYMKDKNDKKVIIDSNIHSKKEMFKAISKYLSDINYKSYYTRICFHENECIIDYGSHNFFLYLNASHEEFMNIPDDKKC